MVNIRASLMIALAALVATAVACGRSEPESTPAPETNTSAAIAPSPEPPPAPAVPEPSTSSLPEQKSEAQEGESKQSESKDLLAESTVGKEQHMSSAAGGESVQPATPSAGRRATLLFSTSVVGSRVRGSKGNEVGKIKDLLFDPTDRRIVYAIISLSNKDVAVPLSAIKIDPERHNYTLEMSDESLAGAPEVGKDKKLSPDLTDAARQESSKPSSSSAMKEPSPSSSKEPSSTATKDRFAPSAPMKDSKSVNP